MAFRIPHALLSTEHKTSIVCDLSLKEKAQYISKKFVNNKNVKRIKFFRYDAETQDILLPMYYASCLFRCPLINSRRPYYRVPGFQMNCTLFDYQEEVVDISIKNFTTYGATFLNVFCSYGKTVVAAYFSAMFSQQRNLITLVTVPRTIIQNSWVGTFKKLTTAKVFVVGVDMGPIDPATQVILCMDTRIHLLSPELRLRVGHLIIDEADRFCTAGHVEGLLSMEPLFITVLTATYERDDGFESMIDLMAGPGKITRISKKPFFVFQIPTTFAVEPRVGQYGIIWQSIVEQLDAIPERNQLIFERVLDNLSEKILILTKRYPQAVDYHSCFAEVLKPFDKRVALVAGNVKQYDDADIIIGTISKLGVGFDEKEACIAWEGVRINMLILASSTKKIEQIAGRVFRSPVPIILDIVDDNPNIKSHWRLRRKWYTSRNGVVFRVTDRFSWQQINKPLLEKYINNTLPPPIPKALATTDENLSSAHAESLLAQIASR